MTDRTLHTRAPLTEAARALADLVLPLGCGGCGRAGLRWCADCAAALADPRPVTWQPSPCPPGYPPTVTSLRYEGPVRVAVHAWKDGGRRDLAPVLAAALAPALAAAVRDAVAEGHGAPLLVPAPSARRTARRRGERPLPRLVRLALAGRAGPGAQVEVREALLLVRAVRDQAGLGARERHANLSGAVQLRPGDRRRVAATSVVVVDDVVTTGATLVACTDALHRAGAASVRAATLAATPRRGAGGGAAVALSSAWDRD